MAAVAPVDRRWTWVTFAVVNGWLLLSVIYGLAAARVSGAPRPETLAVPLLLLVGVVGMVLLAVPRWRWVGVGAIAGAVLGLATMVTLFVVVVLLVVV